MEDKIDKIKRLTLDDIIANKFNLSKIVYIMI